MLHFSYPDDRTVRLSRTREKAAPEEVWTSRKQSCEAASLEPRLCCSRQVLRLRGSALNLPRVFHPIRDVPRLAIESGNVR
jgi:hypothetical protein